MRRKSRSRPGKSFVISRPAQIEALISPARQEIVDSAAASGPLSVREMAEALGRKPSSIYYHVSALLETGLLVETGRRRTGRREEAIYATPGKEMRLLPTAETRETYGDIVASMLRVAGRDFRRAMQAGVTISAEPRRIWGGRLKGWVTNRDLAGINAHIEAIIEILGRRRPGRGARLHVLAWMHAPAAERRPAARR